MENTREIVLDTLLVLERGEEFSHRLLKAVLDKYDYLDGRDKAFIKRVTEGTLERQLELDYYLDAFSSVPVRKMKPFIRCLLRMSVYQILYMDSVPDSAACNEACKLADKRKFHNLKGFVNGVLRKIAKNKAELPMPDKEKDFGGYLSVKYSMPLWLTQRFLEEYGEEVTVKLLEGLMQVHPVSLRFDSRLSEAERETYVRQIRNAGGKISQSEYLPYVYTVQNTEGIGELPGFEDGVFTVQDVSSVLAVEAAGIGRQDFVMDICAAPGGKSILAAEKAECVLSRDVSENKAALIEENLSRMNVENAKVQVQDATVFDETYREKADVVLMDVPCSGLGIIGKKRDIKYHVTPESLKEITQLQRSIVENSWQYVKPGGVLLYSTCTVNPEENEKMVQWIAEHLPFEPESLENCIPKNLWKQREELRQSANQQAVQNLSDGEKACCIQLLPGYMQADGFFFAKFRRVR